MKVLLSAYACKPNCGSEDGKGWNFPLNVAKLGHEVWVLTSPYTSNYENNQKAIEEILAAQPASNLHFVYVDIPRWLQLFIKRQKGRIKGRISIYLHYLLWQKQAYLVAKQLDQQQHFDVVHHVNYGSLILGSELWRLKKPFVFGPVGAGQVAPTAFKEFYLEDWTVEQQRTFIVKKLTRLNFVSAQTVNHADLVLVENKETLELLNQLGGAKRTELALSCGLPIEYFPTSFPTRTDSTNLRLLWVARLHPRKGLRLALQALAAVNPAISYQLTIFGNGPLKPHISSWLKEFQLEDKVEYRGHITWLEMKQEYLRSDVFLFSSLRDTFGSQLLEAMAHGLPIITLDHHGARDFLPRTVGIKVPVTNPVETVSSMAQAIEYMAKNPQERIEMGQAGYLFAKQFSWREKAKAMSLFYEEVTRQRHASS